MMIVVRKEGRPGSRLNLVYEELVDLLLRRQPHWYRVSEMKRWLKAFSRTHWQIEILISKHELD
jgi:hypothetical protein